MKLTVSDLDTLPWPPRCPDAFCTQCKEPISICGELSYIVYEQELNKFIRLCADCGQGKGKAPAPAAPHAA